MLLYAAPYLADLQEYDECVAICPDKMLEITKKYLTTHCKYTVRGNGSCNKIPFLSLIFLLTCSCKIDGRKIIKQVKTDSLAFSPRGEREKKKNCDAAFFS